jgi:primosomal protein N' (replication factor Y)
VTAYAGRVPYASIYPLVNARAVARAFTYEVEDGVGEGAIVTMPFGRRRARGIVVGLEDRPPEGIEAVPVDRVVGQVAPALVELALWLADYYGSTPARALALVAPELPRRRKEQSPPAERQSLAGEEEPAELLPEQRVAIDRIVASLDTGRGGAFLLYGPTGSGKTEVYLQVCAAVLERGLGAILLVPEISLAPQTVGRARARFGESVAILHSGLTDAERRDERERIASGETRVVVGARSAVFAPVRGLGLIVVDEEHDASYKQDSDPRYDARTIAAKRAALEGAVAVFGSATPRPESWSALERLDLGGRVTGELPPVRVVDLRREAGYPLSAPLLSELRQIAEHGGKAILLLNRRGVAPALHCRACGGTIRCPNCDVALVLHGDAGLRCHHCGHGEPAPSTCLACGSPEIARLGAGTQRLERELERGLPELELIRLDADTTSKPELTMAALRRFAETDRAVLLGTQMVAKGHHFAGVALAAVVDADTALALPDFRAEERTFQLITQLAGRSGRDAPGRVLVQTFQPDARPITYAARHDVRRFLAEELDRRRDLGYPPFGHLVRIVVTGPALAPALKALEELRDGMPEVDLLGPAPLLRLRGRYRAQLIAKTDRPRAVATQAARLLAAAAPAMRRAGLAVVVDVDPQSL